MSPMKKNWTRHPLVKLAEKSLEERPGVYLMALRARKQRSRSVIGEVLHSIASVLPAPLPRQEEDKA